MKATILLVMCWKPAASRFARVLEDAGYLVHHVNDGLEAVQWMERNPAPTLVLLDTFIPRKDGFEVREWIRTQPELAPVPVVIMLPMSPSGDDERKAGQALAARHIDSWIRIPMPFEDIVSVVEARLAGKTGLLT